MRGHPLRREDGSVICSYNCFWALPEQSQQNSDHILLSQLRLPQPGGPGPHIYIFQEQGSPVIPQGTEFPFHRLLRLAGLQWRYSNPPPLGQNSPCKSRSQCQSYRTTHVKVKVKVTLQLTVSQSACLDAEPLLVLMTRCLLVLTITVVCLWRTLSDERLSLSIVSQSLHF
jgi:hypothetical protein